MSRIVDDFGHGIGQDRGANGIISEESVIDAVGPLVSAGLRAHGDTVLEVRPSSASSVGNSLQQRVNASDAFGTDLFVSIHANASNGEGHGVEVFTMNGKQHDEAVRVLNNLAALGFTNRGIKDGSDLAVVHGPNAKAMLIEICFIDNENDVDLYNRVGAQAIANAIISGITGQAVEQAPIQPTFKPLPLKMIKQAMSYSGEISQYVRGNNLTADGENVFSYSIEIDGKRYYIDKNDVEVIGLTDARYQRTRLKVIKDFTRVWTKEIQPFLNGECLTASDTIVDYWQLNIGGASAYIRKDVTENR